MVRQLFVAISIALIFAGCRKQPADPSLELLARWDGSLDEHIPKPVRTALLQSNEFELYSLDPKYRDVAQPKEFFRRKVIGKTVVSDAQTRRRLLATLNSAVKEGRDANEKLGAKSCFDPRHAIRVEHEGKSYYLVICFECYHVYVYVDDKLDQKLYFPISESPLAALNAVLSAAGLPLAEPAGLAE
jgi:hypothetical protein